MSSNKYLKQAYINNNIIWQPKLKRYYLSLYYIIN